MGPDVAFQLLELLLVSLGRLLEHVGRKPARARIIEPHRVLRQAARGLRGVLVGAEVGLGGVDLEVKQDLDACLDVLD